MVFAFQRTVFARTAFLRLLSAVIFIFVFNLMVPAQATRTWISGVGDDVNPCSRTAPCKTFAGAISKTVAAGEINCLDPAGFGSVTITKSITLDCKGTNGGILAAGTNGIVINSATAVVRLRGLNLDGAGTGLIGIKILAAAGVFVEDTVIDGFTQHGVSVENSGDTKVLVSNATIRNNAGSGINGSPVGSSDIAVSGSALTGNGIGVQASANALIRISDSLVLFNTTGLATAKGKIISYKNNLVEGNGTDGVPTSTGTLK